MQPRKQRRSREPDPGPQQKLGHNIRARREADGLTQEDLAAECDLHPTEIGRLERGTRDVRLSTLVRVARGLRVDPSELLDDIH